MSSNTWHVMSASTEISVVSTVDEHGQPVEVAVLGDPATVQHELEQRGDRWVRFGTPSGGRVYLHPRVTACVTRPAEQSFRAA